MDGALAKPRPTAATTSPARRAAHLALSATQAKTKPIRRRAPSRGASSGDTDSPGDGDGDGDEEGLRGEEQKLQVKLMEWKRVLSKLSAVAAKRHAALKKMHIEWTSPLGATDSGADDVSEEEAHSALTARS